MIERDHSSDQQGQATQKARSESPLSSLSEVNGPSYQTIDRSTATTSGEQDAKKAVAELDSIRRGELWIIGINSLAVLLALGVCLIYYFQLQVMKGQLQVMRGQLSEMKSGSADTHELAIQAKNQADAVKAQADATRAQSESTKAVATSGLDQAKATNRLAGESARSANAAVINSKAAQDAVITGQKSLLLSERVMFVQERPWVGINTFNATAETGKPITGTITFNNFGRSPAFDVEIITACTFDRSPLFTLESSYIFAPSGSKSIMMPGSGKSTVGLSCDLHLSALQFSAAEQGLKRIYLFGIIRYKDSINTSNPSHTTRFCGEWDHQTKTFGDCTSYNSAD